MHRRMVADGRGRAGHPEAGHLGRHRRPAVRPRRRARELPLSLSRRGAGPYDRRTAVLAAASGGAWEPLAWAYLARETHDTYTNVRDRWSGAEAEAWLAYLDARRKVEDARSRMRK